MKASVIVISDMVTKHKTKNFYPVISCRTRKGVFVIWKKGSKPQEYTLASSEEGFKVLDDYWIEQSPNNREKVLSFIYNDIVSLTCNSVRIHI